MKKEEECVAEMLTGGQIEPSDSTWSSPVVLVTKKDGGTRFCVDYRRLNDATVNDAYPLPRIDDTLDMLVNSGSLLWTCGEWLLAGFIVTGSLCQDGVRDAFWAVSVQGHAVRIVQCTSHIPETNG